MWFTNSVSLSPRPPRATQKSIVSESGGHKLSKLPYVILDNHISKTEALHLLGRVVCNIHRPLEFYAPLGTSACHAAHVPGTTTESSASGSNPAFTTTAQDTYPDFDPALFVLPNLPLSVSESTSATLSERRNYSSQTQSLFSSLFGLSFSLQRTASKTFMINARVLRVLSLNQHSEVFTRLVGLYGQGIQEALKKAGGLMYFVVGIKLSTDATIETREEEEKSVTGKLRVNATQATGLGTRGTAGAELGQVLSGRNVQKELKSVIKENIKGERAFAIEYYCVKLRQKAKLKIKSAHETNLLEPSTVPTAPSLFEPRWKKSRAAKYLKSLKILD